MGQNKLSSSEIIDKRVRFKLTNDPYSRLRFNDLVTVIEVTNFSDHVVRQTKLWTRRDNSGNYTLMDGSDSLDVSADAGI